jgi:hypothetical protein
MSQWLLILLYQHAKGSQDGMSESLRMLSGFTSLIQILFPFLNFSLCSVYENTSDVHFEKVRRLSGCKLLEKNSACPYADAKASAPQVVEERSIPVLRSGHFDFSLKGLRS